MFTLNLSAGAVFALGVTVGIIVGIVSLAVVALVISKKK